MPNDEEADLTDSVLRWLTEFEAAVTARDSELLRQLVVEDSYWRDLVSFTWDFRQVAGVGAIEELMFSAVGDIKPSDFRLSPDFPAPAVTTRPGADWIEAFLEFDTAFGKALGYVRLNRDESSPVGLAAWCLYTKLHELTGFAPETGRPDAVGVHGKGGARNWLDHRIAHQQYEDREPDVVIAGGGHSGIMAAYNLQRLGVDALVVDENERVGDNWRNRYYSLALHNPINMVQFPDLPYPEHFPQYMPKDKLANWIEAYVDSMELNFWTSTEFVGGTYDEESDTWTVTLRRGDGTERVLHPKHVILSTGGVGGAPRIPQLPGADDFTGQIVHSSRFSGGADYHGKKVLVVGVGTSGHDIALDLHASGVDVTMLQRNPTSVVQLETANLAYTTYSDGTPVEIADFTAGADFMYPLLKSGLQAYTAATEEIDKDLHARLRAAGMRLDVGEDGTGWLMKFLRYGGGYYLNVGASDLIADGNIPVIQYDDMDRLVGEGLAMKDGSIREVDAIVLATGYQNQRTEVEKYFGSEIADRVGDIAGFAEDGELRNGWRPTDQPGLWIMIGGFQQARMYSPLVAMQIKARLEGLLPESLLTAADRRSVTPVAVYS
jgi:putative flavoprotein involved in K+ transport